jgi:hypothetical protein
MDNTIKPSVLSFGKEQAVLLREHQNHESEIYARIMLDMPIDSDILCSKTTKIYIYPNIDSRPNRRYCFMISLQNRHSRTRVELILIRYSEAREPDVPNAIQDKVVKPEPVDDVKASKPTTQKVLKSPKLPKTSKRKQVDMDATPSKKAKGSKIAESMDELAAEDKMLISWRDVCRSRGCKSRERQNQLTVRQTGKPWSEIRAEWEHLTGKKPGASTLNVRFGRLKANLSCVTAEDIPHMMCCEVEVVHQIENEIKDLWNKKWARIGKAMEDKGTASYPVSDSILRFLLSSTDQDLGDNYREAIQEGGQ